MPQSQLIVIIVGKQYSVQLCITILDIFNHEIFQLTCLPFHKKPIIVSSPLGGRVDVEVSASRRSHESGRARHLQRPVRSSRQHPVNLPEACAAGDVGFWPVTIRCVPNEEAYKLDEFRFRCQLLAFWMSYLESCKIGFLTWARYDSKLHHLLEVFKWKPGCIRKTRRMLDHCALVLWNRISVKLKQSKIPKQWKYRPATPPMTMGFHWTLGLTTILAAPKAVPDAKPIKPSWQDAHSRPNNLVISSLRRYVGLEWRTWISAWRTHLHKPRKPVWLEPHSPASGVPATAPTTAALWRRT